MLLCYFLLICSFSFLGFGFKFYEHPKAWQHEIRLSGTISVINMPPLLHHHFTIKIFCAVKGPRSYTDILPADHFLRWKGVFICLLASFLYILYKLAWVWFSSEVYRVQHGS